MGHIRDIYHEFEKREARVAVILAESLARMRDYMAKHEYPFPVLSDVRRKVVRDYGVYVRLNFESVNIARPAEFIIDGEKTIRYIYIGSIQTDYPPDGDLFAVLDGLEG